jgi:hypothetical protein
MIDVIVGSAVILFGGYLFVWARSARMRERIEKPKHVFLQQAQDFDRNPGEPR